MKKVEIYVKLKRELYVDSDDEDTIINNAKEIPSPKKEINIYTKMLSNVLSNHFIPLGDWEECETYYIIKYLWKY